MAVYNVNNMYELEKADIEGVKIMRESELFTPHFGKVNFQQCIYWRNRFAELVAVEVDNENLDGYVLGNT